MSEKEQALKDAENELDQIAKSKDIDDIDELTKALEAELGEPLEKSCDDKDKDKDGDKDDAGAEPSGEELEKAQRELEEQEALEKSQQDEEDYQELVKASDAFASLEKSVQAGSIGVMEQIGMLGKSMAALLNLNIKQAKVIAALAKSRNEDMERIEKSIGVMSADLGAKPVMPAARFGMGAVDRELEANALTKSITEIGDALLKAVQEKTVDSRHLSIWGTYRDPARLPDDVKKIIGL